jgi:hypothetical protein
VLVQPSELMSRAWMKDAADAHARDCPNIKRIINQFNRISRWVASEIVCVTDDAQMRLSMLKRFIKLAHCCRRMYAIYVGLEPVGRAATQGPLGEAADQVGEALRRARPADLQSQVELGRDARCCCAASTSGSGRRLTICA